MTTQNRQQRGNTPQSETPPAATPAPDAVKTGNGNTQSAVADNLESLRKRGDALRAEITTAVQAGESFDKQAAEYAEVLSKLKTAELQANAGKINDAKSSLGRMIAEAVKSLGLSELLGEPVTAVVYQIIPPKSEGESATTALEINSKVRRTATRKASGGPRQTRDLGGMMEKHGTAEEKSAETAIRAKHSGDTKAEGAAVYQHRNKIWENLQKKGVDLSEFEGSTA